MDAKQSTPEATPKTKPAPRCAGCGERVARVFEVLDSLTFFEGDLVCRECADNTASETA